MKLDVAPQFYRPNVGLMLIGPGRRVFIGQRLNQPDAWQMPQGGVDKGETPVEAACRELGEEVGTTKALLLRESHDWVTYDVPEAMHPRHWKGRWKGQAQKWFALAFTGSDPTSTSPRTTRNSALGGGRRDELLDLIVAWKRRPMKLVLKEFRTLLLGPRHSARSSVRSATGRRGPRENYAPCSVYLAARLRRNHRPARVNSPFSQPVVPRPTAFSTIAIARCTWNGR